MDTIFIPPALRTVLEMFHFLNTVKQKLLNIFQDHS